MSEIAKCRVHELIDAGDARGDKKPRIAAAITALIDSQKRSQELSIRIAKELNHPVKELACLLAIEEGNGYFSQALGTLLGSLGLSVSEMRPIIEQLESAAKLDLADIKAGKINPAELERRG